MIRFTQLDKEFLFAYNHLYIFNNNSNGITSGSIYKNKTCNWTYYGHIKKQNILAYPYGSGSDHFELFDNIIFLIKNFI